MVSIRRVNNVIRLNFLLAQGIVAIILALINLHRAKSRVHVTRCRIYLTMGMARHSRSLLKGAINTRLTHRPLVIYTQPVVTFASLITIDKSLEEHTPLLYVPPFPPRSRNFVEKTISIIIDFIYRFSAKNLSYRRSIF